MEMTVAVQMKINNTDDGKTMIILRLQSSMKITKACQRRLTILSELNWTSKDKRNKTHTHTHKKTKSCIIKSQNSQSTNNINS